MLPDSKLDDIPPQDYATSVPIAAIGEWALAQYATVEELRQAIPKTAFWSQNYYFYAICPALSITLFMIKRERALLLRFQKAHCIFMIIQLIA